MPNNNKSYQWLTFDILMFAIKTQTSIDVRFSFSHWSVCRTTRSFLLALLLLFLLTQLPFCCLVDLKFEQRGRSIAGTGSLLAVRWVTVVIKVSQSKHNLPDLHTFLLAAPNNLTNHSEKGRWPRERWFCWWRATTSIVLKPTLGWN